MWTTEVVNKSEQTIYANEQTLAPGEIKRLPYAQGGITIFTAAGTIKLSEPSKNYRNNVRYGLVPQTSWAVLIESGHYSALVGYEGGPVIQIEVGSDTFLHTDGAGPIAIGNQPFAFILGRLADSVAESEYIEQRFGDFIGEQVDRQAATAAIRESVHVDVPLGDPVPVSDPGQLIVRAFNSHLIRAPLREGEEVLSKTVRLWDGNNQHPFLTITTNQARIHIPLTGYEVEGGELVPRPTGVSAPHTRAVRAVPVVAVNLAKELGKAMLTMAGTVAWSYVKKNVLGLSDIPKYYDEVLERIEAIVIRAFERERSAKMRGYAISFDKTLGKYNVYRGTSEKEKAARELGEAKSNNLSLLSAASVFNAQEPSIENIMFLKDAYMMDVMLEQEEWINTSDEVAKKKSQDYIREIAEKYAEDLQERHTSYLDFRMAKIDSQPFYSWKLTFASQYRTIGGVTEGHHALWVIGDRFAVSPRGTVPSAPHTLRFEDSGNGFWWSMAWDLTAEISSRPDGGAGTNWRIAAEQLGVYREKNKAETLRALAPVREAREKLLELARQPIPAAGESTAVA